jgi:hypothetical protein
MIKNGRNDVYKDSRAEKNETEEVSSVVLVYKTRASG